MILVLFPSPSPSYVLTQKSPPQIMRPHWPAASLNLHPFPQLLFYCFTCKIAYHSHSTFMFLLHHHWLDMPFICWLIYLAVTSHLYRQFFSFSLIICIARCEWMNPRKFSILHSSKLCSSFCSIIITKCSWVWWLQCAMLICNWLLLIVTSYGLFRIHNVMH